MEKKFINHIEISDFEILTDTGWEDILGLYETIEYHYKCNKYRCIK